MSPQLFAALRVRAKYGGVDATLVELYLRARWSVSKFGRATVLRSAGGNWRTCENCPTCPLSEGRGTARHPDCAGGPQETVHKGSAGEARAWDDLHGGVRDVVAQAQFVGRGADRHVIDDAADEAGADGGGQRDVLAGLEIP